MQISKRGEPLPINQALNKSRTKLGLTLPMWMGVSIVSIVALLLHFYFVSLISFVAVASTCWLIVRQHPRMFELWGLSLLQASHYDPRKK
jgi:hypothetical protein